MNRTQLSQTYFNPFLLSFYDFVLYQFISPYFWGCSSHFLIDRYHYLSGGSHLEVGVGTGYLLDKLNPKNIDIDLMDLNIHCLNKSKRRLARFTPRKFQHDILKPVLAHDTKYHSISLNYVMHCVPGNFSTKSSAFGNLKKLLKSDGILFGATVLKSKDSHIFAKSLIKALNILGIFNNSNDSPKALKQALDNHFKFTDIQIRSSTALFFATDNPIAYQDSMAYFTRSHSDEQE